MTVFVRYLLIIGLVSGAIQGVTAYGGDLRIDDIKPLQSGVSDEIDYGALAKKKFAIVGVLHAIYDTTVVINDGSYLRAGSINFSGVTPGMTVGAEINQKGEVSGLEQLDPSIFETPKHSE